MNKAIIYSRDKMNYYGKRKIPFFFVIDFEMLKPKVFPIEKISNRKIMFDINGYRNFSYNPKKDWQRFFFKKKIIPFGIYKQAFDIVNKHQKNGNSYLLNLTFPTEIETNLTLKEIFFRSIAKYKLYYQSRVVFSPETFVSILDGKIISCPMKGTIDADILNAKKKILQDKKEFAEHSTIVDLIRNDLNMVATDVTVESFRYVEKIKTNNKDLLQVSSRIVGTLPQNYRKIIGNIIYTLLPAGSISGAPKTKTIQIIKEAEKIKRGYYTGIFGYFDGDALDSAVAIRYIEHKNSKLYYRSGGGITVYSSPKSEYQEMADKVYVPIIRDNQDQR